MCVCRVCVKRSQARPSYWLHYSSRSLRISVCLQIVFLPVIGPVLLVKHKGVDIVVLHMARLVVAGGNALLSQRVRGACRGETSF